MAIQLITISEYIVMDDSPSPLSNENQVSTMITKATSYIEKKTGQLFYYDSPSPSPSPLETVEIISGKGSTRLYVKNSPIVSITKIEYWNTTEWYELSIVTYPYVFKNDSYIIYSQDGFTFWEGYQNWRVTYTYGYMSESYPEDLKYACYLLTKYFLQRVDRQGLQSQTDGEQSFTYDKAVPKEATEIIARYSRL